MAIGVVLLFVAVALAILAIRGGYTFIKPWSGITTTPSEAGKSPSELLTSAGSTLNRITKF